MKKLEDILEIIENNMECVVLSVKPNSRLDLICLGFEGNEELFRVTKGKNHTYTVWNKNGDSSSHEWGENGYTLISEQVRNQRVKIVNCIVDYFDIYIEGNKDMIAKTLHCEKPKNAIHTFKFMWWKNDNTVCIHKDNQYYKHDSLEKALLNLKELGFKPIEEKEKTVAQNGCYVKEYVMQKA